MVQRERALETVGRDLPGRPEPADIVDQHIDRGQPVQDLRGHSAYLRLAGQVRDEHLDLAPDGGPNLGCGRRSTVGVPAGDRHLRAQSRQAQAVALPIPPVPPVTSTVSPVIGCMGAVLRMLVLITDLVVITATTGDARVS